MNAESFVKEVHQTVAIPLRIISQKEEGAIAFFSAASSAGSETPDELVVWDIGTGSFQLTIGETENDIVVFMGNMGAVPFKNYITMSYKAMILRLFPAFIRLERKITSQPIGSQEPLLERLSRS